MVVIEFDMQIKIYMNQANGTSVVHEFFNRYLIPSGACIPFYSSVFVFLKTDTKMIRNDKTDKKNCLTTQLVLWHW